MACRIGGRPMLALGDAVGATALFACGASPCVCLRHGCRSLYIHTNQLNGTLGVGLSALTRMK